MKFVFAIALFVLGQCLVADAWYVTCSRFDRHVRDANNDRSNLWYHVRRLNSYRSDHNRRIATLKSQTSSLTSQLDAQKRDASSLGSSISSANSNRAAYSRLADSQENRIRKLERVNPCMFDELIIRSLAENLLK